MKNKIKYVFPALFLAVCLMSCGSEREINTVGDTNNNVTEGAFYYDADNSEATAGNADEYATQDESKRKEDEFGNKAGEDISGMPAAYGVFKPGTWVVTRPYVSCCYMVFYEDGLSGSRLDAVNGNIVDFSFEVGALPEELKIVSCEQIDEDYINAEYADGTKMSFRYVSEKTDGFTFYPEEELCRLAVDYYNGGKKNEEVYAEVKEWDHASVTVAVYTGSGEEKKQRAVYVMDRVSARSKNLDNNVEFLPVHE